MKLQISLNDNSKRFADLDSLQARSIKMEVGFHLNNGEKPEYSIDGGNLVLEIQDIAQSVRESVIGALRTMFSQEITVTELSYKNS